MKEAPIQLYIITKSIKMDCKIDEFDYCSIGAAFAQAAHAKAMDYEVHIFLEASGVNWAYKDYQPEYKSKCFNPLEYFQQCIDIGVGIEACQTCIYCSEFYYVLDRNPKEDLKKLLRPEIEASSFTNLQKYLQNPCNIFTF